MNEPKKRKFNIVDIIVLLILLAAVVFFAIKVLKPEAADSVVNAVTPERKVGTAHLVVEVAGLRKDVYDTVADLLPCEMLAYGKLNDGRVLSATCKDCELAYIQVENSINQATTCYVVPDPDTEYVTAFFECEAPVDLTDDNHASNNQELRIGRMYYVKGLMFEFTGTIIQLEVTEE